MKDLTHYFQLPSQERENKDQKEIVEIVRENYQQDLPRITKNHSKCNSIDNKDSFSSSSVIGGESKERTKQSGDKVKRKVVKSKSKNANTDEDKNVSPDIDTSLQDNIQIETEITAENSKNRSSLSSISSSKTSNNNKNICLSLRKNRNNGSSNEEKTQVTNEGHDEKVIARKKLKKNRESDASFNGKIKKRNSSLKGNEALFHKSFENCSVSDSISVDNSKTQNITEKVDSLKTSPPLDDNRNAFYILMSSRSWKSPHDDANKTTSDQSSSEKKLKDQSTSQLHSVEMKENKRKRKKKLESMIEQKMTKKIKCTDFTSEEKSAEKSSKIKKRITIVPESDSDDDNILENSLKSKSNAKENTENSLKKREKESNESTVYKNDKTSVIHQKFNVNKLAGNKEKMPKKSTSNETTEENKLVVEESDDDDDDIIVSKKRARKKLKIDFNNLSVKINSRVSPRNKNNFIQAMKPKKKFVIESSGSDSEKEVKEEVTRKNHKHNRKQSESKNLTSEKESELNKKGPTKNHISDVSVNFVNEEKINLEVKMDIKNTPNKHKSPKEFGSVNDHPLITLERKKQSEKILVTNKNINSNAINKDENNEQSGDTKRNSLFSYFNKVTKNEVVSRSEKIQVKAQIHSPPVSPSSKHRNSMLSKVNKTDVVPRRRSSRNKVSGEEDQIIVLETLKMSEVPNPNIGMKTPKRNDGNWLRTPPSNSWRMRVKLRDSSVEPSSGSDVDDDSFTPRKKKWVNSSTSIQQKAAREVLRKAKSIVTQRRSQDNGSATSDSDLEKIECDEVVICSSPEENKPNDAPKKLAPLFLRKTPKPKLDPAIVEARKIFLNSGVPEPVKKFVDLQRSMEEKLQFTFPSIAHVQQKEENSSMWKLPIAKIPAQNENTVCPIQLSMDQLQSISLGTFTSCSNTVAESANKIIPFVPEPIKYFRKLLHSLKLESPNFPVYRNFRRLRLKNVKKQECSDDVKKKKRSSSRRSRNTRSNPGVEEEKLESCNNNDVMWTEKYKPQATEDIISNLYNIEQLKKWLESWKSYNDEMLMKDNAGSRKRKDSSSGEEFMDSDSNESSNGNLPNNTAVLIGPHGCGKTAAVYAIANELGCKVLEINTSSKRNGKRILSELQEATQSHQVVRAWSDHTAATAINSFFKGNNHKIKKKKSKIIQEVNPSSKQDSDENNSRKMSIILVEGVDLNSLVDSIKFLFSAYTENMIEVFKVDDFEFFAASYL
ncbi:hypothetical protein L9F63_021399, partial [Diploptera punctata]